VVAIPAAVVLALAILSFPERDAPLRKGRRAVVAALACAIGIACAASAMGSPRADAAVTRAELFSEQRSMEGYAREHADTVFYTNMTGVTLDPVHGAYTYADNVSVWGGSFFTVDDDHPCADEFFRDDVRLIAKPLSSLYAFLQYLSLDNGPVAAVLEERLADGIIVVRITRAAPEVPGYTGWYESGGLTYYFENGQAVTGTRTIDGTAYTFAPPGAAASMVTIRTDDGAQIYTTDAYSLILPEA